MPVQESTKNESLVLNPEFKSQLLALKTLANSELNIQVSLDKMVSDNQYRLMVLSELDGLGSNELNELVAQIKLIPVYIKLATIEVEEEISPSTIRSKNSSLIIVLISLLFLFVVTGLVGWKTGYLKIGSEELPVQQLITEKNSTLANSSFAKEALAEKVNEPKAIKETAKERIKVVPVSPDSLIKLPSDERKVLLRLNGSNTIGEKLAPALLESYLLSMSVSQMKWLQGDISDNRELQFVQDGEIFAIQLSANGSTTGFKDLLSDNADMSMSSRRIKDAEIEMLRSKMGDLSTSEREYIIGLDGLAIIVNKNNPIISISNGELAQIFSGEIRNWKEIGGEDLAIKLYARDEASGTWDSFNRLVLKANLRQFSKSSQRYESSTELSNQVSQDVAGIGFIGLPYVNNSKALAISAEFDGEVIYPIPFTISTNNYVLSRLLYMYTPSDGNLMAKDFSRFVVSQQGQEIVEQMGFVSQGIKLEDTYKVKNAPESYNSYAEIAKRLSISFHFKNGSNEFDSKAQGDIIRLADYLTENRGRRIVLMGFTDSLGDPKMNESISLLRAQMLEKELNAYGLNITAVEGFGVNLPIASNLTAEGRSKNRRVEVWIY